MQQCLTCGVPLQADGLYCELHGFHSAPIDRHTLEMPKAESDLAGSADDFGAVYHTDDGEDDSLESSSGTKA